MFFMTENFGSISVYPVLTRAPALYLVPCMLHHFAPKETSKGQLSYNWHKLFMIHVPLKSLDISTWNFV